MNEPPYFKNHNEAMLMGIFQGTLTSKGIEAFPEVDDEGNYTDVVTVLLNLEEGPEPVRLRWCG